MLHSNSGAEPRVSGRNGRRRLRVGMGLGLARQLHQEETRALFEAGAASGARAVSDSAISLDCLVAIRHQSAAAFDHFYRGQRPGPTLAC